MIRHIGIRYVDQSENDSFGPHDVVFTDLDTNTILGDGWVKLDKTWIISVQFIDSEMNNDAATIALACNSNADKSKCPIIITDPFSLSNLDVVLILTTSTETWEWYFIKRELWEQLNAMDVKVIMSINPDESGKYMAVECVSNGEVVNPIFKVRGFVEEEVIEEQNAFTEIHARTKIYSLPEEYVLSREHATLIPYILQNTNEGVTAILPGLWQYNRYFRLRPPMFED